MSTEQLPRDLENALSFCAHANLSGFAGVDETKKAHNAIRAEHAQRLTLQHHATDLAQRVADLERQSSTYKAAWSGYHPLADYMRGLSDAGNLPGMLGEHFGDIAIKHMQGQDARIAELAAERDELRARLDAMASCYAHDSVWEALQRMIEDGQAKGPASREDALTVARHRDRVRLLAARPVPAQAVPDGCGACGDGCAKRGSCRLADESPEAAR